MADRNVKVTVRADVADFLRGAGLVEGATKKMADGAKKAAAESKTGMAGIAQHARDNRDAWGAVGGALTAYGAAMTGLTAIVAKTGIEYNTLRQRSGAALTTMTGSAEAANAQMAKLDAFASNSPFARDVFIRAQQQMFGFRIESEKVIPYLDAIQNAVAATGGSNQDIAELSTIFSQISASAKITATDLREFGNRGVDAATLIGEQMGMTGAQVRDSITAGTLDAGDALDALAAGMQDTYGGAADNVKNTMLGAVDRVKAAFRDLSASSMEVFVDPEGNGGLAVDGLNALADALRRFEDMPAGLRNTMLGVGGLTGVVSLLGGAALLAAPRLVETYDALGRMGSFGQRAQDGLKGLPGLIGRIGTAATVAGGIVAILKIAGSTYDHLADAGVDLARLENQLVTLTDAAEGLQAVMSRSTFDEGWLDLPDYQRADDAVEALRRLADPDLQVGIEKVHDSVLRFFSEGLADAQAGDAALLARDLADLDSVLSGMATTSLSEASEAFVRLADGFGGGTEVMSLLLDLMPGLRGALTEVATEMGVAADDATLLAIATGDLVPSMEAVTTSTDAFADALVLLPEGAPSYLDRLKDSGEKLATAIGGAADGFVNFGESLADTEVSLDGWLSGIEDQITARAAYLENVAFLQAAGVNAAFLEGLADQGADGQLRAQQMVDAITGGDTAVIERANEIGRLMGDEASSAAAGAIAEAEFPVAEIQAEIDRSTLNHEVLGMNRVIEESTPVVNVDADAQAARNEVAAWAVETAETFGITQLDSNPELAYRQIEDWNNYARTVEGMPLLNANPALAQAQLDGWYGRATLTTATAVLNANPVPAGSVLSGWKTLADRTAATATLYANASPAQGTLQWFLSQIPRSVTIGISAVAQGLGALYGRADGGPINRASGGPVHGPGGPRDDLVPAYNTMTGQAYRLSSGEHILTTAEVDALGGHGEVYRMRKAMLAGAVRYDIGGAVGAAYQSRQVYSAPMHAAPAAAAGPSEVDTGQIAAAVSSAMSSWQPMVSIDGRQFHGVMLKAAAGARRAGG